MGNYQNHLAVVHVKGAFECFPHFKHIFLVTIVLKFVFRNLEVYNYIIHNNTCIIDTLSL